MVAWPDIPYAAWAPTCRALHLYCQILGKYRLAHTPWLNHSWHATLYVVPRGLTTGPVPDPSGNIVLTLDVLNGTVEAEAASGARATFRMEPMRVADFFTRTVELIEAVGGTPTIHGRPNEVPDPVPFRRDLAERPWDGDAVCRFHEALSRVNDVFATFRTGFIGKVSPPHLFWGSFDLAVTRFSGRPAPRHPGGVPALPDEITWEAYSHEVSSAGFWPGGGGVDEAMFYSYAYPTPEGFGDCPVRPDAARFDTTLGEFLLPYEAVRTAADPEGDLLAFLQSTYAAAAELAAWDRAAFDAPLGVPLRPRPI